MSSKKTQENSFSHRLRLAMAERCLNQHALSTLLGTTQSTVSGWLNRGSSPRGNGMIKLADALGVPLVWLAHGERGSVIVAGPSSHFARRELLEPMVVKEDRGGTFPLPPPEQQHMLSAIISVVESVQIGALPLEGLHQAYAILDVICPLPRS